MREIPVPLVRANQGFLMGGVLLAVALDQPLIVAAQLLVVLIALRLGPRGHPVFAVARAILGRRLAGAPTEDARLQRFNLTLAGIMLTAATGLFAVGWSLAGWIVSLTLAVVAAAGLAGFCLGCHLYRFIGPWMRAQA